MWLIYGFFRANGLQGALEQELQRRNTENLALLAIILRVVDTPSSWKAHKKMQDAAFKLSKQSLSRKVIELLHVSLVLTNQW